MKDPVSRLPRLSLSILCVKPKAEGLAYLTHTPAHPSKQENKEKQHNTNHSSTPITINASAFPFALHPITGAILANAATHNNQQQTSSANAVARVAVPLLPPTLGALMYVAAKGVRKNTMLRIVKEDATRKMGSCAGVGPASES
jgi:hypothetical protein